METPPNTPIDSTNGVLNTPGSTVCDKFVEIADVVKKIQTVLKKSHDTQAERDADLEQFSEFRNKYPKTWNHIIEGNFSMVEFKKMNEVYTRVYNHKNGEHLDKKNLANVAVGNLLAEKYLYPVAGRPTTEQLQHGYAQVLEKNEIVKSQTPK